MLVTETTPPSVQGDCARVEHLSDQSPVLMRLEADYGEDGRYGRRFLEVTAREVRTVETNEVVSFRIPIEEVKSARNEPLVGGGRLEITTTGNELLSVLTYSLQVAARFSEAARGIEQLSRGEELNVNLKAELTRCEKCGRLLPEKDGICPACINRSRTMWRVFSYLRPYKGRAIMLATVSLITTAVNLAPPRIQGLIIDNVLSRQQNIGLLWQLMALWLLVLLFNSGMQIVAGRLNSYLGSHIAADIRASVFRAVEWLQLSYFDKKQVGAITSRVSTDTDRIWTFLTDGLPYILTNGLLFFGVTALIFSINYQLALCIIAPLPLVLILSSFTWPRISQLSYRFGQKWSRLHTNMNETVSGIRVMKAFAQEDNEHRRFLNRNHEVRDACLRLDKYWYTVFGFMSLLIGSGALINWSVGGYMVYLGRMTLGEFWQVHAYLGLLYGPMQWFAVINNTFSRAMAGAERVFEVIDAEPEQYNTSGPPVDIKGEVIFDTVSFGYDKSNPVLKNVSMTAQPGEMIGLVGKSGAGKSTTIGLLCRFHDPDTGTIRIDGIDYRDIPLQELRRQVGLVLQEPFLFNGTIAENISYGKPGSSLEEIMEAAKAANAHGFILSKPDGYDTVVGERGSKLSGGERQRVSIARAILHDPRILILDEATSSVDVETEKAMQEAIAHLVRGRTTFAIAHRLATLRNATRLVVLEKGEIVETGTHTELMSRRGVFYNLVKTQSEINEIIGERI